MSQRGLWIKQELCKLSQAMFRMSLLAVIEKELMLINWFGMCVHLCGSKRHMGPEKIGLPVSIVGEARCSARSFGEMRVALCRLALAEDASCWKLQVHGKSNFPPWEICYSGDCSVHLAQWNQWGRAQPGFANASFVHVIGWACSKNQYWGTSWPDGFLQSHCFSPSLHMYCFRDLFPLGILFFYFCLVHSFKGHCAKLWEFNSSSWGFFVKQSLIIL